MGPRDSACGKRSQQSWRWQRAKRASGDRPGRGLARARGRAWQNPSTIWKECQRAPLPA